MRSIRSLPPQVSLLQTLVRNGTVVAFADMPRIREVLTHLNQQIDICQRALRVYLEDKRASFPKFYFLGDDDLLEIVGQGDSPEVIQNHLR